MQVVAVSSPSRPDWRWRIVNYAGETIEESHETFSSIAAAVQKGGLRLHEMDLPDHSAPPQPVYRSTSFLRSH